MHHNQMSAYVSLVSPTGEGGISIIHLLGYNARKIIRQIFKPRNNTTHWTTTAPAANRLYLGYICEPASQKIIDEVIIHYIPAERTASGLDMVEITAHGGIIASQKIISCLRALRIRVIAQDQLGHLAYQNRNLDLIRQEALTHLLRAPTRLASLIYLAQYKGQLSEKITQLLTWLKPTIHQPAGRIINKETILFLQSALSSELDILLSSAPLGLALSYPRRIVLIGCANVGKSTLFNTFFGRERVLTHHLPGTTRDPIEETIALKGIPFKLIDTAGLISARGPINKVSQKNMWAEIKRTDINILLLDSSCSLNKFDYQLLKKTKGKTSIIALNKIDLHPRINTKNILDIVLRTEGAQHEAHQLNKGTRHPILKISALQGTGLDQLKKLILDISLNGYATLAGEAVSNKPVIFLKRQYNLLKKASGLLSYAKRNGAIRVGQVRSNLNKVNYLLKSVIGYNRKSCY